MSTDSIRSTPAGHGDVVVSADPFRRRLVHWKDRQTWYPSLEAWLEPKWAQGGKSRLRERGELDLCWDDSDWLDVLEGSLAVDVEDAAESLTDSLDLSILRAFHGCRVLDAGVFHREGLKINDPAILEAEVRRIVAEEEDLAWLRPSIEQRIAEFDARERDTGRLYVCADDTPQLDHIGHYLLYGSEWVQSVLGWGAHRALRRRGAPTMVEIDLPFKLATRATRRAFAEKLLQEWTRVWINQPTFVPALDFTVALHHDLPPSMVVGHYHPKVVRDPFNSDHPERTPKPSCPHCE